MCGKVLCLLLYLTDPHEVQCPEGQMTFIGHSRSSGRLPRESRTSVCKHCNREAFCVVVVVCYLKLSTANIRKINRTTPHFREVMV